MDRKSIYMARTRRRLIDKRLSDFGLDCPEVSWLKEASWLSFSCRGTFTTKDVAYRMFDSAQMAYALEKAGTDPG